MDEKTREQYLMKLIEQQGEIKQTLVRIEADVKEHIRRTANLEGRVEILTEKDSQLELALTRHVARVNGAGIFLGLLATVVSLTLGALKIFNVF